MTTAIVIDPALSGPGDPHHAIALGFIDAAHASGCEIRILGHRDRGLDAIEIFPVEKAFGGPRVNTPATAPDLAQRQLRTLQFGFRDSLVRTLGGCRAGDILILPQPDLVALNGLAAWASGRVGEPLPRLVVFMTTAPQDDPWSRALESTAPVTASLDRLGALFGDRCALLASTPELVARYDALGSRLFTCLPPGALCARDRQTADAAAGDARLTVLAPLLTEEPAPAAEEADAAAVLPGVDIIVTLFNYRRFLRDCLASVARQSYPNWRCVVVDDASTDIAFETLRAQVASFGPRFSLAPHVRTEGQTQAVATGLSLGANTFVVMLDADDRLEPEALDQHIAWHLNSRVPVALTSGQMRVVDARGRLLSGALDNVVILRVIDRLQQLPAGDAFRRPGAGIDPQPALFADRDRWPAGEWYWAPSSGMMFRRGLMELVLPDDVRIGFAADTYFAFGVHAFGSSILIDAIVARYTRHGGNAYADTTLYGAATLAVRAAVGGGWAGVAPILRYQIGRHRARFDEQINADIVVRVLALLKPDAGAGRVRQPRAPADPPPPPFVPRVIRRLRHEGRRLRGLARRIGLA